MHILNFRPEILLYIYLAGCISVLLFNIVYIFWDELRNQHSEKRSIQLEKEIKESLKHLDTETVKEHSGRRLPKEFKSLGRMRTFEQSVEEIRKTEPPELVRQYLQGLRGTFIRLIPAFRNRDEIAKGYYAYLIERFGIDAGYGEVDSIMEFLTEIAVEKDDVVRENSLRALYSIGNADAVLNVWQKMNDNGIFHSTKLLADGLAMFSGNKKELARLLWSHREEFAEELVLPVMQFIRFFVGGYGEEYYRILKNQEEGKELLLEIIRYFKKYPYEPAKELLGRYLDYMEFVDWEYAAVASLALASYPGEDTVRFLKKGLTSNNWYVRLNSAESLVFGLGLTDMELADVYNGSDRYAREILQYAKNHSAIENQKLELVG